TDRIASIPEKLSVFDFSTQRTSLRLGFKNTTYSTEIIYNNKNYNGIIKDISLKGAGLVLDYEVDYNNIHIGDFVTLNIDFKVLFFKILKGIVIRKNQHENLLGIKIDLDDPYMIDNENMIILNRIIDSWITKLLSKEDILSSLK
ncbi:MAG TPA: PilZ domain-containing protein, partial [Spirochaetota bacterium]|nr:PilZ domain-containing protein [Spirochaetota bacterium]